MTLTFDWFLPTSGDGRTIISPVLNSSPARLRPG